MSWVDAMGANVDSYAIRYRQQLSPSTLQALYGLTSWAFIGASVDEKIAFANDATLWPWVTYNTIIAADSQSLQIVLPASLFVAETVYEFQIV